MYIKLFIISVILVAFFFVGMAIKLVFKPKEELPTTACSMDNDSLDKDAACAKCDLKEIIDCPEKE